MRKHWLLVLFVFVVAVIATMVMSFSQERQMGGGAACQQATALMGANRWIPTSRY